MPERVVDLLEVVDVEQCQRHVLRGRAPVEHSLQLPDQPPAIGEFGEEVVGRLVLVHERLRAQPTRGSGDQVEQGEVQHDEADAERQVEGAQVVAQRRRDRCVRHVDLERADHLAGAVVRELCGGGVDPDRHVHREQLSEVAFFEFLGTPQVGDERGRLAREGSIEGGIPGEPPADESRVVAPDDPALAVPDLQAHDAVGADRPADRVVELAAGGRVDRPEVRGEVGRVEQRLHARLDDDRRVRTAVVEHALALHLPEPASEHQADGEEQDEADDREPCEQTGTRRSPPSPSLEPKSTHNDSFIGTSRSRLESTLTPSGPVSDRAAGPSARPHPGGSPGAGVTCSRRLRSSRACRGGGVPRPVAPCRCASASRDSAWWHHAGRNGHHGGVRRR